MKASKWMPKYGYVPFFMVIGVTFIVFYITRLLTAEAVHYDVSLPLDSRIPFAPQFIWVYVLAYVQWVLVLVLGAREGKDFYFRGTAAEMTGKSIAFFIFLFLPTCMTRGDIQGDGLSQMMTRLIYTLDEPNNLFPSLHCLDSWVCLRLVLQMKKVPKWFKMGNAIFSFLVFASVVLVKQHLFLDIWGGILVGELGFFIVRAFHTEKLLYKIIPQKLQ